eukprot:6175345-Pleurochrysis_carterae.AAC.3
MQKLGGIPGRLLRDGIGNLSIGHDQNYCCLRIAEGGIKDAPQRCYELSTRELASKGARMSPVGASTLSGERLRALRDGASACVAAWVSEGVVIWNEVE